MKSLNYISPLSSGMDERATLANITFGLIYSKYNGNITHPDALAELYKVEALFKETIRNYYELRTTEIPISEWLLVRKGGDIPDFCDGHTWTRPEYNDALMAVITSYNDKVHGFEGR